MITLTNMKIGMRLGLGFGLVLALMAVLTGLTMKSMSEINARAQDMYTEELLTVKVLDDAKTAAHRLHSDTLEHILADQADTRQRLEGEIDEQVLRFDAHLEKYRARSLAEREKDLAETFGRSVRGYAKTVQERILALSNAGKKAEAVKLARGAAFEEFRAARGAVDQLIEDQIARAKWRYESAMADYRRALWVAGAFLTAAIALGLSIAFVVARSITRPLAQAVQAAQAVARGDLDSRVEVQSRDETGQLLAAMKHMTERLSAIVTDVRRGAASVASVSRQISDGNVNLSQRAQEQASSLEETAASMEEMTSTVKQNANNARLANQLVADARGQAQAGGEVVTKAIGAMEAINASSKKIDDIIGVIDEIAFQTNLLALNAAVEAARAGEQGRGFAVVATEVRTLAQRSAAAAKEIKALIKDSVEKAKIGSEFVDASGHTLAEIVGSVKKVDGIVAEIAAASQEQSSGIEQVSKTVMQMDAMTQQNAALVEEAAVASRSMDAEAQYLMQAVAFFKIGEAAVQARPAAESRATIVVTAGGKDEDNGRAEPERKPVMRLASPSGDIHDIDRYVNIELRK